MSERRITVRDIFTTHYLKRHFNPIMGLLIGFALTLIVVGKYVQNDVLVAISTSLFSACTIGAIFKLVGYDVFLLAIVREIIYERRFFKILNERELRILIREAIAMMRGLSPKEEKYEVFEKYLLDDLVGIATTDRRFIITLSLHKLLGHQIILGKTVATYDVMNESPRTQSLFNVEGEDDVIYKGIMTIPEGLKKSLLSSPLDPTAFWDLEKDESGHYVGFRIDGKNVDAEKLVKYKDQDDPSKGVKYKVKYHGEIEPSASPRKVEVKHKCIFDTDDYIIRKFGSYGKDLEVIVNKPKNIKVSISWLLTAVGKEPHVTIELPKESPTSYIQKVKGVLIPGNGFIVMWWPKTT